jgi:hypothetical protein
MVEVGYMNTYQRRIELLERLAVCASVLLGRQVGMGVGVARVLTTEEVTEHLYKALQTCTNGGSIGASIELLEERLGIGR